MILLDILNKLKNGIVDVFRFVSLMFEFIPVLISFFPNPFRMITIAFLPILISMYLWKLYNGGD